MRCKFKVIGYLRPQLLTVRSVPPPIANAPPGEYVAVGFDTTFVNATVEEKVVFQKDQDQWKVVGYFISRQYKVHL